MRTLGICFGATTMQCVVLHDDPEFKSIISSERIPHEGNPRDALLDYLGRIDRFEIDRIAVTGRHFRTQVACSAISEPEAIERALHESGLEAEHPDLVVSLGGETQLVYRIGSGGTVVSVHSGSKCASGTGEFFLQQIRRMGMELDEAIALAREGTPHRVAGRCSVFCKSDCTHALNKGEPKANVVAGLCQMMADKIDELVKEMPTDRVVVIGGGSRNSALVSLLRKRYGAVIVPELADSFEAYGAALWAMDNECRPLPARLSEIVHGAPHSFGQHRPLSQAMDLVDFKASSRDSAKNGDECVVGLDVGSTTTKAVLIRKADAAMLASIYLRTSGDPVNAARECYAALLEQIGDVAVRVQGVGVTGSGRQIAALHALSTDVINEIIAHATAAAYYDESVDTIFEIGGQDAKYTSLVNGVPSDYAMNEACSAGTGSFLEEAARESLNVDTTQIGELALLGQNPPNFTDQCAAFISSDIKRAGHEGIGRNDILAGLVYSICMNYLNKVKGARPVGRVVFMQGGVCYNKAVPVAMASLMKARIVVPPDPGLMGAFGVALEVVQRQERKLSEVGEFDLRTLAERDAVRESSFVCAGGKEKCDRKCQISRIRIGERVYPFGGICDRYYNTRINKQIDTSRFDLVALRQRLMYDVYGPDRNSSSAIVHEQRRTVGLNRSFLMHSLYPLFSNFFSRLGFDIVLSDSIDPRGVARIEAAFCLPAELSHGAFTNLLEKKPDFIFLPQVMTLPVGNVPTYSRACVFVQGEPYFLKSTFRNDIDLSASVVLNPVLKMQDSYHQAATTMTELATKLGIGEKDARNAWSYACEKQIAFERELKREGRKALHYLDRHRDTFGVVLFGRPYNAFADEANMGIPHKVASRGYMILPLDMLPAEEFEVDFKMFWAMGQKIMKAARFVKERANLFGFYITNFSCGPDSFLLGYFRTLMEDKPSLTLELDQHTADAGLDTRIEAALDIMTAARTGQIRREAARKTFVPARVEYGDEPVIHTSDGARLKLTDPGVEVVLPSMGAYGTQVTAAVLRGIGIDARALPIPDKQVLLTGRKNTSCKECLPYILTTGSFLEYLEHRDEPHTVTLCFLPTGGGPCRLGQYCRALEHTFHRREIPNAAPFTLTDENGYSGLGARALLRAWQGIVISDVFADIKSMLAVTAADVPDALRILEESWQQVLAYFEGRLSVRLMALLSMLGQRLRTIPLKRNPADVPVVSLVGEIYVRHDEFSRKNIVDYLEGHGFMVRVAPVGEYLHYSTYVVNSGLGERPFSLAQKAKLLITTRMQEWWERRIKTILATSGLYHFEMIEVDKTIEGVKHLVDHNFRGECILTIGLSMREILNDSCGVVSIGPFGCMPSRMAEAVLKKEMNVAGKERMPGWRERLEGYEDLESFPFLSIETDGTPFPQLVEANLEAFALQARRVHERMRHLQSSEGRKSAVEDRIVN